LSTDQDIIEAVESAFADVSRPAHFTNYLHCDECAEHDQTLLQHDRDSLRVGCVNNPGWDPICFCSPQGKAYYIPALVRFALEDSNGSTHPYWQQLLFHLEADGPKNVLIEFCSAHQRQAIAMFLEHLIVSRASAVEKFGSTEEALRTYGYWATAPKS